MDKQKSIKRSNKIKIRACPFCGETKEVYLMEENITASLLEDRCIYYMECYSCLSRGPKEGVQMVAISGWNNRKRIGGEFRKIRELEQQLHKVLKLFDRSDLECIKIHIATSSGKTQSRKIGGKNSVIIKNAFEILKARKKRRKRRKIWSTKTS